MIEVCIGIAFFISMIIGGIINKDVSWFIASGLFYIGIALWNNQRRGW